MWRLGGLSPGELLKRTARETWQDDVFGLSARLAFYYFLAIFPVIALLLIPLARLAGAGADMRGMLADSLRRILPLDAGALVDAVIGDLNAAARTHGSVLIAAAGASWAGLNASWAMITGLNVAYETREDRSWGQITGRAASLALAVVALVLAALLTTHFLGRQLAQPGDGGLLPRAAQWAVMLAILMISLALFYRFGPNVKDPRWRWSTPGAVFAATLWVASTVLVQEYFDHIGSHTRIYGRLAATAALLIWLYVTSATVLIGAELNSEIEKAGERRPQNTSL